MQKQSKTKPNKSQAYLDAHLKRIDCIGTRNYKNHISSRELKEEKPKKGRRRKEKCKGGETTTINQSIQSMNASFSDLNSSTTSSLLISTCKYTCVKLPSTDINTLTLADPLSIPLNMSFLFGGPPKMSSAEKIAAAETEVEMVSDMFNRWVLLYFSIRGVMADSPLQIDRVLH